MHPQPARLTDTCNGTRRLVAECRTIPCMLQIIERQTCQVAMDDVMLFADQFDPAHQLVGEVVDPAPEGGRLQPYSEVQSADQYKLNQKLRNIEDGLFKGIQHYCFKMHFSRY